MDLPFLIFKAWLQNRHNQVQKPPNKSFQVSDSKKIQNSDFRFVIYDAKHLRSDRVYFTTHSQKPNAFW